jgi:hypothetical protein
MILELTATATAFTAEQVGTLVVAVITALGAGGFAGKKIADSRRVNIDNQPLEIRMKEEFVSRQEFRQFRSDLRLDLTKLENLVERNSERVEAKHLELLATIERVAKIGVDGRVHLWKELNLQGKQMVRIEEHVDVAQRLERIALEISKSKEDGK